MFNLKYATIQQLAQLKEDLAELCCYIELILDNCDAVSLLPEARNKLQEIYERNRANKPAE